MATKIAVILFCLFSLLSLGAAEEVAEHQQWCRDFNEGRLDEVELAVVTHMEREGVKAMDLAAMMWCRVQVLRGRDSETAAGKLPEKARKVLGELPRIYSIGALRGDYNALYQAYPRGSSGEVRNVFSLWYLRFAAAEAGDVEYFRELVLRMAERDPSMFQVVDGLIDLIDEDPRELAVLQEKLAAMGEPCAPLVEVLEKYFPIAEPLGRAGKIELAKEWIEAHPSDGEAYRALAWAFHGAESWDRAFAYLKQGTELLPRGYDPLKVQLLVRLERIQEMEAEAERLAGYRSAKSEAEQKSYARFVKIEAHRLAGEIGAAWEHCKADGDEPIRCARHLKASIRTAISASRHQQAMAWAKEYHETHNNTDSLDMLLEALRKGDESEAAQELIALPSTEWDRMGNNAFYEAWAVLNEAEKHEEAVALLGRYVERTPEADWIRILRAQSMVLAGDLDAARKEFEIGLRLYPGYSWGHDRYHGLLTKIAEERGEESLVAEEFGKLARAYPWVKGLWTKRLASCPPEEKEKIEEEARQLVPGSIDFAGQGIWDHLDKGEYQAALEELEELGKKVRRPDDRVDWHRNGAWVMYQRSQRHQLSAEEAEFALGELEKAEDLGETVSNLGRYRVVLHEARDDYKAAALELERAFKADPDYHTTIHRLFSTKAGEELSSKRIQFLQYYVDRNPFEGNRYVQAIEYHAKWGGSRVIAIALGEKLKEVDPENHQRALSKIAKAYGGLGDHAREYQTMYQGVTWGISTSQRYIDWWNAARLKAQQGSAKVEVLEDGVTARIRRPGGEVEFLRFHPRFGKYELLQKGEAWVKAEYSDDGNLTRVLSSSDEWVALDYGEGALIRKMRSSNGDELEFEYGDLDKPTMIKMKEVGFIVVEYDGAGEITKVESGGGGEGAIALRVTQAFQSLLTLTSVFETGDLSGIDQVIPEDERLEKLVEIYGESYDVWFESEESEEAEDFKAYLGNTLTLAKHLFEQRGDASTHLDQARQVLDEIFEEIELDRSLSGDEADLFVQCAGLWYQIIQELKPDGVTADDFAAWGFLQDRIDRQISGASDSVLAAFFKNVSSKPLVLMKHHQWLPQSYLSNPGFWSRHDLSELIPDHLGKADFHCALVRGNGHRVVGTGKGLCLLRKGFWEHLGFDESTRSLVANPGPSVLEGTSIIHAVVEDSEGRLWLGTGDGILLVNEDYSRGEWIRTGDGETGSTGIHELTPFGDKVLARGEDGLSVWTVNDDGGPERVGAAPEPLGSGEHAQWVTSINEELVVCGGEGGIYAWGDGEDEAVKLVEGDYEAGLWLGERLYLLRDHELYSCRVRDGELSAPERVPGQNGIVKTHAINGLVAIPISAAEEGEDEWEEDIEEEVVLGVLTDQGISLYRDFHFEYLRLPWSDQIMAARGGVWSGKQGVVLASGAVYAVNGGQAIYREGDEFTDMFTHPESGDVWMAGGGGLRRVWRDGDGNLSEAFLGYFAHKIALAPDGKLVVNDGTRILRITVDKEGEVEEEFLFSLTEVREEQELPVMDGLYDSNTVLDLLADSHGNVWVVTTRVLYRHHKGGVETFTFDRDTERFPARSDRLFSMYESHDGKVWLTASNEGHLSYRSITKIGGMLEWDGERFHRTEVGKSDGLQLVTGYTEIGDGEAVVSTSRGFVLHDGARWSSFGGGLKDASYLRLQQRHPEIWMGTAGTRMGEDLWLFGSAAGILGYKAGQWFYPERLNWMLPDQHLAEYGSRAVHAVAASPQGFLCATTDGGLMTYDFQGGSATAFLMRNNTAQLAVLGFNQDLAREEADIVLSNLEEGSRDAEIVGRVRNNREKIDQLKSALRGATLSALPDPEPKSDAGEIEKAIHEAEQKGDVEKLEGELARLLKTNRTLLLRLERDNYSLYQAMTLNPLELTSDSVRKSLLKPKEKLVQFIPDDETLFIHLVSRDRVLIREVNISRKELEEYAVRVSKQLAADAAKPRGAKLEVVEGGDDTRLLKDLSWLYEHLLRPIEYELEGTSRVYVAPSGALTYVPFSALVTSLGGARPSYAVEKFNIGYITSMYHLDLVRHDEESINDAALVFGDPDSSLAGARQEATLVHEKTGTHLPLLVGKDACVERVVGELEEASLLHFATHATLRPEQSDQSFLLCAGGDKLTLVDAMALPLGEVDLVVLSACETGIGARGNEYATLARAFAHAGAPTVVATLWRVSDWPSQKVMSDFHDHLKKGADTFTALGQAQRKMVNRSDKLSHPSRWAGYVPFGKP